MRKVINLVVLFILIINITGCATILKDKETKIKVNSEPQGAEVYIVKRRGFGFARDNQVRLGRTPTTLTLNNRRSADLNFKKDGYEESNYTVKSELDGAWMTASFVCAIFPAFIDLVSRNARSFKEKEIKVILDSVLPKQTDQITTKK